MDEFQCFGLQEGRLDSGRLRCGELERIAGFLRFHGSLLVPALGGWIILRHPATSLAIEAPLPPDRIDDFHVGAGLQSLLDIAKLRIADIRVFEALTPGSLILEIGGEGTDPSTRVCLPDDVDLRDIASTLRGSALAVLVQGVDLPAVIADDLGNAVSRPAVGVLRSAHDRPWLSKSPTLARVRAPGKVECMVSGTVGIADIEQATQTISQHEIADWT